MWHHDNQMDIEDKMFDTASKILTRGGTLYLTSLEGVQKAPSDAAVLSIIDEVPYGIKSKIHMWIELEDSALADIKTPLDTCHNFIDDNLPHRDVYVHCYAGMSRSATIVIAYMMRACGMNFIEAIAHVRKCRPIINPNHGFIQTLVEYST